LRVILENIGKKRVPATGRERLKEAEQMLEAAMPSDRASASRVVAQFIATQHLLDSFVTNCE
jgi:hypothetical protein